jgi:hypothetical protein
MAKKEYKVQTPSGKSIYEPPEQSGVGQIFDSIFLLIIIYLVLLTPLALGLTAGNTEKKLPETITWETLGQNQAMQAQWTKLGMGPKEAAEYICTRFVYTVNPGSLIFTGIVIVGYFFLVLRLSDREYREVINEHFD